MAGHADHEAGPVKQVFEHRAVDECCGKGDNGIVGFGRAAIGADKPEGVHDFLARQSWEELIRVLEASNRDSMPEVDRIDRAGEGRADPAIAIVQDPGGLDGRHFGSPKIMGEDKGRGPRVRILVN